MRNKKGRADEIEGELLEDEDDDAEENEAEPQKEEKQVIEAIPKK